MNATHSQIWQRMGHAVQPHSRLDCLSGGWSELTVISFRCDPFTDSLSVSQGMMMIISWVVLAVSAIFFTAWLKPALIGGMWFQVHRAVMLLSLLLTMVGFMLIFIANKDNATPGLMTFHCVSLLGTMSLSLSLRLLYLSLFPSSSPSLPSLPPSIPTLPING